MRQGKFVDTTISFTSMAGYSPLSLGRVADDHGVFAFRDVPSWRSLRSSLWNWTCDWFAMIDAFFAEGKYRAHALQSVIEHMALPCLVLALAPTTQVIRLMRASVAEVMTQTTSVQHELKVFQRERSSPARTKKCDSTDHSGRSVFNYRVC